MSFVFFNSIFSLQSRKPTSGGANNVDYITAYIKILLIAKKTNIINPVCPQHKIQKK